MGGNGGGVAGELSNSVNEVREKKYWKTRSKHVFIVFGGTPLPGSSKPTREQRSGENWERGKGK